MAKALYILGAGGHSSVLADILKNNKDKIDAIFSPDKDTTRQSLSNIRHFQDENQIFELACDDVALVNGIGSLPGNQLREKIFSKFSEKGYFFRQVLSKSAIVSPYAELGKGVQVMAGAIIQAGAKIGDNSIINTGSIIEHDCVIGAHNHIAPGVTLSGEVTTGSSVHIGTGAVVIQGVSIGERSIIAAGAIITKNIETEKIAFGARSKVINKRTVL